MNDLIPKEPLKRGRRQSVTAKAWITRRTRRHPFTSKVSLGKGRIYELATETLDRKKALAFNRAHLLKLLAATPGKKSTLPLTEQLHLLPEA